jgi:hypothetical protein
VYPAFTVSPNAAWPLDIVQFFVLVPSNVTLSNAPGT